MGQELGEGDTISQAAFWPIQEPNKTKGKVFSLGQILKKPKENEKKLDKQNFVNKRKGGEAI